MRHLFLILILFRSLSNDGHAFASPAGRTAPRPAHFSAARPVFAPPAWTGLSPGNNAVNVPLNTALGIMFDQEVKKGAGFIRVFRPDGAERFPAIDVAGDAVTLTLSESVSQAAIALPAALSPGETVYVTVDNGTFAGIADEPFAGISGADTWRFTTDTAPVLTGLSPVNGAVNVPVNQDLALTFSEPVQRGSGSITIQNAAGALQTIAVADANAVLFSGDNRTVTVRQAGFPSGAALHVRMPAGAFTDLAGIPFAGINDNSTWAFTAADVTAPTVTALSPAGGAANVPGNAALVMNFSEPIRKGTGNITIFAGTTALQTIDVNSASVAVNANAATITPPANLPSGAAVSVQMPAGTFTDLANLPYAGIGNNTTWAFTVADATAPVLTALSPAGGAANVGLSTNLVLTFSEPVRKGSGSITIAHGSTSQTIPVAGAAVLVPGGSSNTITIDPADFPAGTTVSVTVPATAFADASGNAFAGTTGSGGASPWSFATDAPPAVSGLSPANGATGVPVTPELVLDFSEPVKKGTGSITIFAGATALQTIDVNNAAVAVSGSRVSLRPSALPSGAAVYVQMPAGTFTDLANIPYAGIPNSTTWAFTVADAVAPTVTALSPANGAVNVGVNTPLTLTFSEPVRKGTGSITIYQGSSLLQTISVAGASVSVSGNTATITPLTAFPSEASLFVIVPGGAFTDAAGNAFAGINDPASWAFRIGDVTAPAVSSLLPVNGAVDVSPNGNLVITFNEPVKQGAGGIVIRQGNTVLQTIDVNTAAVSVAGPVVILDPPTDLPSGAAVNVQMPAGVFADLAGNPFAGIATAETWTFTVADENPPAVTAFSPAAGAVGVATGANLVITFNEPVQKGTGSITIFRGATALQTIEVSSAAVTAAGNTVTITPPADLEAGALLNVQMPAGAITDLAGNPFAGIPNAATWQFTVIDNIPPALTSLSPANGSTGVAFNARLVLNFTEPVKKGTGNIVVYRGGTPLQTIAVGSPAVAVSGNTVTITPAVFPSEASLHVLVGPGVFLDQANNPFGGITDATTWAFTVADVNAPTVSSLLPANNAAGVAVDAQLTITFSEAVRKGTGNIAIYQGATVWQTIGVDSDAVTVNGSAVTIVPPAAFPSGAGLNVRISGGAFLDLENNTYAGISDASTWQFSVADVLAPAISSLSPANGATGVAPAANLVLAFNEPVRKGAGTVTLLQNNVPVQTIDVGSAAISLSGNVVTVDPATNLPSAAALTVNVSVGAFADLSGNAFAGILNGTTWAFTVADVNPPTVTALSPANGAVGVAPNVNLLMTFNKPVRKGSGSIILIQGATSQTIPVGSSAVVVEDNTVRIVPPAPFPSGGVVSVLMFAGVFTDLSGNPYGGIADPATWRFTVADVDAPLVTNLLPANGASGVAPSANLAITFNKSIKKGSGFVVLSYGSNTSQPIDVSSAAVTVTGSTVLIDPPANFPSGVKVNVQMASGVFTDLAGNNFAGITDALTWTFTIVDVNAPAIAALSPGNGATAVPLDGNLQLTFTEPVRKGSGDITIFQGTTPLQIISVSAAGVTVSDSRVTIDPENFPSGVSLHVQMPAGAFRDLTDNPFGGIADGSVWRFTTLDTIPPRLSGLSPADNVTRVNPGTSLVIQFTEPVRKGSGAITIHQGRSAANQVIDVNDPAVFVAGNSVTIKPANDFPSGAEVFVTFPGGVFTDLGGNAFAGLVSNTAWNFSVTDVIPPAIAATSPPDDATGVAINATLTLTLDKPVRKGATGYVLISQGATSQFIPVSSPNIVASGNTITITPPDKFPYNTDISVQIPGETVTDASGNTFRGITDPAQWNFRTVAPPDLEPPVILAFVPADNAINVPADSKLSVTFNEPVQKGSGSITLTEGAKIVLVDVNDQRVGVAGNTVTITLAENFPVGADVSVQMTAGAFRDLAGNAFAGIADATVWNFLVAPPEDRQFPAVVTLQPANGASGVPAAADLVIRFSEKIRKGRGNIILESGNSRQLIPVTGNEVMVTDSTVTINPPQDLPGGASVNVILPEGAFADLADNLFAALGTGSWRFTVAGAPDRTPFTLSELAPSNGARNVAPDIHLTMVFAKDVRKGAGSIRINAGGVVETIGVANDEQVVVSGNRVTIRPSAPFTAGVPVLVTMLSGVFTDPSGNSFAGLRTGEWRFSVNDNVPPRITGLLPADDALNVPANTGLVVRFNKPVEAGTGAISLWQNGVTTSIPVDDAAQVTVMDNLLVINPAQDFPFEAAVSVVLPAGLVKDGNGNPSPALSTETEWNFSVGSFADRIAPALTQLSPADDAQQADAGAVLTATFDEPVLKGSGTVTVTVNGQAQTYDVRGGAVSLSGNSLRIRPTEKLPYEAEVRVTFPAGTVVDPAGNAYGGITTPTDWNFTVAAAPALTITEQLFPETIASAASAIPAYIAVDQFPAGATAELVFRGIAGTGWTRMPLLEQDRLIEAPLTRPQFDQIGLEYYFELTLADNRKVVSDTGRTYIYYPAGGLPLPNLRFGARVEDYQMFSIPLNLENQAVSAVLEDNLGEYKKNHWRLFHYNDTTGTEYDPANPAFNRLNAGEGYWLIVRNQPGELNSGAGTTLQVDQSNPYRMQLRKGWNQVGNPYNFSLSWADVRSYNNNPSGLGNLYVFEEGYRESDVLRRFQGAFVFAAQDLLLDIPVTRNVGVNGGRRSSEVSPFADSSLWELQFGLRGGGVSYGLSGVGMNANARPGKDDFDRVLLPRFGQFADMSTRHPDYFAPLFAKDVAPVRENYRWDITVASNLPAQEFTLDWQAYLSAGFDRGKRLVLYDPLQNKSVNLLEETSYRLHLNGSAQLVVLYGSAEFVQSQLKPALSSLGPVAPNPFSDNTTIAFGLADSPAPYQVQAGIYNLNGQRVRSLANTTYAAGTYAFRWDGRDDAGRPLPPGLYICRMAVHGRQGSQVMSEKIVLR